MSRTHVPPRRFEFSTKVPLPVLGARTEGIVFSLTFFSVSLVLSLSRNVSTLTHSPYRVLSLLSRSLTLSLLRFLFTLWFLFCRPQTGFTSVNVFGFFLVYILLILLLFLSTNNECRLSNFYWLLNVFVQLCLTKAVSLEQISVGDLKSIHIFS